MSFYRPSLLFSRHVCKIAVESFSIFIRDRQLEKAVMTKPLDEVVFLVEEAPEGGYTARALGVSIFTEADDMAQLRINVVDAVRCHFAEEPAQPRLIRLHLVKDELIKV